jgi:hypothetical protein
MAKDTNPDPSMQFQEWVTQWERAVDDFSNKVMGTDEFSKSLNQMQGLQIEFQRRFGEMMATYLTSLNMPTRDDVIKISEEVRGIDRRLAHIERSLKKLVDQGETKAGKPKGPSRTRKPKSE